MQSSKIDIPVFLRPAPFLYLFFFTLVTSFHHNFAILSRFHFEFLLVSAILGTAGLEFFIFKTLEVPSGTKIITAICLVLICMPLFSSIANDHYFSVLQSAEYRSWVKMLVVAPVFYVVLGQVGRSEFLNVICFSLFVLGSVFAYRYVYLGEVRAFDLRPLLQMKNGDPNFLSLIFGASLPLVLFRMTSPETHGGRRVFFGLLFAGLLACALATESRMGFIAILAGFLYLVWFLPKNLRLAALFLLAVVCAAAAFTSGMGERFTDMADGSNRMRLRSIVVGLTLFSQSPLFGFGWDSAPGYFYPMTGYPRLRSESFPLEVHNTPIQLLAELGIFGFVAYFGILGFAVYQVRRMDSAMAKYLAATLIILSLNLLTLPLLTKDFVLLFLVMVSALAVYDESKVHSH